MQRYWKSWYYILNNTKILSEKTIQSLLEKKSRGQAQQWSLISNLILIMIPLNYLNPVPIPIVFSKDSTILHKSTFSLVFKMIITLTKRHTKNLVWLVWQSKQRFLKMMMLNDNMSHLNQLEVHKLERILEKPLRI